MTQDTTLPPAALTTDQGPGGTSECPALVVLWSRNEPERTGEVLLVPHSVAPWIFGRGETSPGERRLALVRQRPAANQLTGPRNCWTPSCSATSPLVSSRAPRQLLPTPMQRALRFAASGRATQQRSCSTSPPSLQAHLLRVLDGGEYQRLGEAVSRRSDFRLVAATNRPEGDLKHDLLARLKITDPDYP